MTAEPDHKGILKRAILEEVGSFDRSKLTAELDTFIRDLENGRV